jgi:glutamate-1-semialdehyde aminotransferase/spore coat polysaccharide biosynthesis protein SpsF (cytidylyltransferase family)
MEPTQANPLVTAIIQARVGSTRLPEKVFADIEGRPMLWHVANRVRRARLVNRIVVATSEELADRAIAAFCERYELACYRGSEADVLDRFYQTAQVFPAEFFVRITADCPLLDPDVIDRVVEVLKTGTYDYVSNTLRYTYPDGLDVEGFTWETLSQTWREAKKPSEREHVTPYMRLSGKFRLFNVKNDVDLSWRGYRWSVDDEGDLQFIRRVYAHFVDLPDFRLKDVLGLLEKEPALRGLQGNSVMNEGYYRSLHSQATTGPAAKLPLAQSQAWFARSRKVIPGCSQTFSKGYTQYVQGVAPIFLQRGKGCRVWDVDGNEYIDYVQGLLPNILGYAHEEVTAAAAAQLANGHSFSLPHPLEVELAERLTSLIPCAEMVRFVKNGSDATAAAIRVARAFTGRDRVACCGYHGWQDWYIGSTTRSAGVPEAVRALTRPFAYNDPEALAKVLDEHRGDFAAVIMEPVNFVEPKAGYLQKVKELAHQHGALLIFDEICSGFHFGLGGAQKRFEVTPDLACFGKAMGNGFPIACVLGRADVMKLFEEIFVSFTLAGEAAAMAAALKVLDILEQTDALAQIEANGKQLQDGFNVLAKLSGLSGRLECAGYPWWSLLKFRDEQGGDSLLLRSLFQQEAVKRGILLLVTHNMTTAHDAKAIEQTLEAYAAVLKTLATWLSDREPARHLQGPMIQPVFRVR